MLKLNVLELLDFYDTNRNARPHSNAIKTVAGEELGFALLVRYLKENGKKPELLNKSCTAKGNRLDGWVKIHGQDSCYYQVEVKSWSWHGYGSNTQIITSETDLEAYRERVWESYWQDGSFRNSKIGKVLKPMNPPVVGAKVEPLACLWSAVHPEGKVIRFFRYC